MSQRWQAEVSFLTLKHLEDGKLEESEIDIPGVNFGSLGVEEQI